MPSYNNFQRSFVQENILLQEENNFSRKIERVKQVSDTRDEFTVENERKVAQVDGFKQHSDNIEFEFVEESNEEVAKEENKVVVDESVNQTLVSRTLIETMMTNGPSPIKFPSVDIVVETKTFGQSILDIPCGVRRCINSIGGQEEAMGLNKTDEIQTGNGVDLISNEQWSFV